jgi:magnesium chelatase family protein
MNPCPCGYFNDKSRECMCTLPMIQLYVAKISGPLTDRIDIDVEVPAGAMHRTWSLSGGSGIGRDLRAHTDFARAIAQARREDLMNAIDDDPSDSRILQSRCRSRTAARARHAPAGTGGPPSPTSPPAESLTVAHLARGDPASNLDRSYWS